MRLDSSSHPLSKPAGPITGDDHPFAVLRGAPVTWILTSLSLGLFLFPTWGHRTATINIWPIRLLGCHLLHWTAEHLMWDVLMFWTLGLICELRLRTAYYVMLVLSGLMIPIAVFCAHPEITSYRGLSGIDTSLFALLVTGTMLHQIRQRQFAQATFPFLLLLGLLLKTGLEMTWNTTFFVSAETCFTPLPLAHLVGAAIGISTATLRIERTLS